MNVPTKLAGCLLAILVIFVGAMGVGTAVGPVGASPPTSHEATSSHAETHAAAEAADGPSGPLPKGLMVSQDGYSLRLEQQTLRPGATVPISFTVDGPAGSPVTGFDVQHEKRLHLVAVRRDLSGFQHVHPTMDPNGTWRSHLRLTPGQWRVFADFKASDGEALTLGTDLAVAGAYRPVPPASDSRVSSVDGFTVALGGSLAAGTSSELTLTVSRNGQPVTDLEPYLGAYGHLVALRAGDLAYLHVHPEGTPGDGTTRPGPEIAFRTEVPSPGRYHLFLDFQHGGVVRTAAFTVTVPEP